MNKINRQRIRREMKSFYGERLPQTIGAVFEDLLRNPPNESIQLTEELALTRAIAREIVSIGSIALDPEYSDKLRLNDKVDAAAIMTGALNQVRDMTLAASRIEKDTEDKISIRVVYVLMDRIIRAIQEACGQDFELAKRIVQHIDNTVIIPEESEIETTGTEITPDMQVSKMDEMITGENNFPLQLGCDSQSENDSTNGNGHIDTNGDYNGNGSTNGHH